MNYQRANRITVDQTETLIEFEGGKYYVEGREYKQTGVLSTNKRHERHSHKNTDVRSFVQERK